MQVGCTIVKGERLFQSSWKNDFHWLEYNEEKLIMTCKICMKYDDSGTLCTGCSNFKLESVKKHDASESHRKNDLQKSTLKIISKLV